MSTRKDLRTSESDWRATKQPTNRPLKAPKKTLKVTTVLKVVAIALGFLVAFSILWEGQQACIKAHGESRLCVD